MEREGGREGGRERNLFRFRWDHRFGWGKNWWCGGRCCCRRNPPSRAGRSFWRPWGPPWAIALCPVVRTSSAPPLSLSSEAPIRKSTTWIFWIAPSLLFSLLEQEQNRSHSCRTKIFHSTQSTCFCSHAPPPWSYTVSIYTITIFNFRIRVLLLYIKNLIILTSKERTRAIETFNKMVRLWYCLHLNNSNQ